MKSENLIALFEAQAKHYADQPWLFGRDAQDIWQSFSWNEVATHTNALARQLLFHRVNPGDRVFLLADNSPQWIIANLAIIKAGAISVPAYVSDTMAAHEHILRNVEARFVICEARFVDDDFVKMAISVGIKRLWVMGKMPDLQAHDLAVINLNIEDLATLDLQELPGLEWPKCNNSDVCTIIHTSGTSGQPLGVMLTHRSIIHNLMGVTNVWKTLPGFQVGAERFLSFLPLSHSYEYLGGQFVPMMMGAQIYYVRDLDRLLGEMQNVRPTIMTAVPRFFEMVRGRILGQIARQNWLRRTLFFGALGLGKKAINNQLNPIERIANKLADRLVRKRIAGRLGGELKTFASGGGPLPYEVGIFFAALGVRILQGYGLSETSPVVSVNLPHDNRMGTVGQPLQGVDVMINPDGEILIKGDLLMKGYWNDEARTKAQIKDGWLHTGDIGKFDNGYLVITDRKKDIIVNSGGENIAPQRVEGILGLAPEILQVMVYGDHHPHLVALVVPDLEVIGDLDTMQQVEAALKAGMDKGLLGNERIRKFCLADEPFTIENGLMTPSMKIRRHKILEIYRPRLEALYRKDIIVKMNKVS